MGTQRNGLPRRNNWPNHLDHFPLRFTLRTGFFTETDFRSVLGHLPEYLERLCPVRLPDGLAQGRNSLLSARRSICELLLNSNGRGCLLRSSRPQLSNEASPSNNGGQVHGQSGYRAELTGSEAEQRMAPQVGLEPTTLRLTVAGTAKLPITGNCG